MTIRERVQKTLRFEKIPDRLPVVEWAHWWDKTMTRWKKEGFPDCSREESLQIFGLDPIPMIQGVCHTTEIKPKYHGAPLLSDNEPVEESYEKVRSFIMTDKKLSGIRENALKLKPEHDKGDCAVRLHIDGFFSYPRRIFGIEPHMFAFYDHPELMHKMNADLVEFNKRILDTVFEVLIPDIIDVTEDMSYNHGPMLSYEMFKEFLLPYYKKLVPKMNNSGAKVFIDSDGDITGMIPWFYEAGVKGALPLERQAGVDVARIRKQYPDFMMFGAYDKMVMSKNETAMRAEFERLLPVMRSGGYLPGVDHQTPPEVSLENYRIYVRLLKEYCRKAAG